MLRRSIVSMADSTTDVFMRIFGPFLEQRWGQPIVLDLKPGGGAAIGLIAPACFVAFSAVVCVWLFQYIEVVHTGPSSAGLPQLLGHSSDAAVRDSLGSRAASQHGNEALVASGGVRDQIVVGLTKRLRRALLPRAGEGARRADEGLSS